MSMVESQEEIESLKKALEKSTKKVKRLQKELTRYKNSYAQRMAAEQRRNG